MDLRLNKIFANYIGQYTDAEGRIVQISATEEPLRIDEVSANVTYIGYAQLGTPTSISKWKIKKIEVIGTETIISYAGGKETFEVKWDDRASLSY